MANFLEDPEQFFRNHSIVLPVNPDEGGKIGQMELMKATMTAVGTAETHGGARVKAPIHAFQSNKKYSKVQVQAAVHDVAWVVGPGNRAELVIRQAPAAEARLAATADPDWFRCLVLPWTENAINYMQIPRDTTASAFMTGAMNGCTFVVTGDPREPFVSHINSSATQDKLDADYQAKIQKAVGLAADGSNAKTVTRTDYKLDRAAVRPHEQQIEQGLGKTHKVKPDATGEGIITDTLCFVMGVRQGGSWRFFYQQVITHKYSYIKRLGKTGGWRKWIGKDNRVASDNVVYRALTPFVSIWPEGLGRVTL